MTAHHRLEPIDENQTLEFPHRTVYDRLQDHRQLAWLACATTSLLTTRHLLIERNLHYPLQLYASQIAATAILAFITHPWRRSDQEVGGQEQWRKRPIQGTLLVAVSQCLQAVSALCITQAVLHTSNLPLLCMIVVSSASQITFHVELTFPDNSLLR